MTRDDIVKMVRKAGISMGGHPMNPLNAYVSDLERFAALVAAHERNACADICKDKRESLEKAGGRFEAIVAGICEQRIRSRGP